MLHKKLDLSEHKLIYKKGHFATIHHLKKPNTGVNNVKFINVEGILSVTGDFGNWIFCRSFLPSPESHGASRGYMDEKLEILSKQKAKAFCAFTTEEEIKRLLKEEENLDDEEKDYLESCLNNVEEGEFDGIKYK